MLGVIIQTGTNGQRIKGQQAKFEAQVRQFPRTYIAEESRYFQGERYVLHLYYHDAPPRVVIGNKTILEMYVRLSTYTARREAVITQYISSRA